MAVNRVHWFNALSEYGGQKTMQYTRAAGLLRVPGDLPRLPEFAVDPAVGWCPGYGMVLPLFDDNQACIGVNAFFYNHARPAGDSRALPQAFGIHHPGRIGWMGDSSEWHMGGDPKQTNFDLARPVPRLPESDGLELRRSRATAKGPTTCLSTATPRATAPRWRAGRSPTTPS